MDKKDLSIACSLWGNWPDGNSDIGVIYVNKLFRAVEKYLSIPHRFFCFTDKLDADFENGVIVKPIELPTSKGRLGKLYFYNPNNGLTGRVLGFDLDTLIIDNIDDFANIEKEFVSRKTFNPRRVSHNVDKKIGGDLISFNAGWGSELWELFSKRTGWLLSKSNGSERKALGTLLKENQISFWQDLLPGKYINKNKIQNDKKLSKASLVSFHGKPYLHKIKHPVVNKYWGEL